MDYKAKQQKIRDNIRSRLDAAIDSSDYSRNSLSEAFGKPGGFIGDYFRGRKEDLKAVDLGLFCEALNVPVQYVMGYTDDETGGINSASNDTTPIDSSALLKSLEMVEQILDSEQLELESVNKAKLVALVYELSTDSENADNVVDLEFVRKLTRYSR